MKNTTKKKPKRKSLDGYKTPPGKVGLGNLPKKETADDAKRAKKAAQEKALAAAEAKTDKLEKRVAAVVKKATKKAKPAPAGKTKTAPKKKPKKPKAGAEIREESIGRSVGVATGLSVSEYWSKLFVSNSHKRLSDPELVELFRKEFPRRQKVQPVGRVRSFYNRGLQGFGNPPGMKLGPGKRSKAYENGEPTRRAYWGEERPDPARSESQRKAAKKAWKRRRGVAKANPPKKPAKVFKLKKPAKKTKAA